MAVRILIFGGHPGLTVDVMAGITEYATRHTTWRIETALDMNPGNLKWSISTGVGGFIALFGDMTTIRPAVRANVPVVSAFSDLAAKGVASVVPDEQAVGALGVGYLADRGYRRVGFYGVNTVFAIARCRGAIAMAKARSLEWFSNAARAPGVVWPQWSESGDPSAARRFLQGLKAPAAVLAYNDSVARVIVEAASDLGMRVPGDLAVIGIDNAASLCEVGPVTLTSVDPGMRRIGYESGRLLDSLLRGRPPALRVVVPPKGVVERLSTDPTAVSDPLVATALKYIREHSLDGGTVGQMCEALDVSRRHLEKRFLAATGRSPGSDLRRRRLDIARDLLASTNLSLTSIALRCGYERPAAFSAVFRREIGCTPRDYRKRAGS